MGKENAAWYNEIDRSAAKWLHELMASGHIQHGVINEQAIQEIKRIDVAGFRHVHFFAGIGGWAEAIRLAKWPKSRQVWTGSCPCQPYSIASPKRRGDADERNLWPFFRRLISECLPSTIFGEQVASKDGRVWIAGVRSDLEAMGYAVGIADLCAAGVQAPHIRQRLYWVADRKNDRLARRQIAWNRRPRAPYNGAVSGVLLSDSSGRDAGQSSSTSTRHGNPTESTGGVDGLSHAKSEQAQPTISGGLHAESSGCRGNDGAWEQAEIIVGFDGKARRIESGLSPLAYGVPGRVGLLRGYGNAIVPQLAAEFVMAYLDAEKLPTKADLAR